MNSFELDAPESLDALHTCTKVRVPAALRLGSASVSGVLSLWKLRVGAEAYYLAQVARGLDDYYTGQGEVPGVWVGNGAPALGLDGEVDPEDLRAVLAGLAPGTGLTPNGQLLRAYRRRVPGFDLTFSVPKSVSVVYALGDPLVRGEVVAAGEAALASTVAWLEREACHVRRGSNNRAAKVTDVADWGTRRLPGVGFVAAAFRHRVSRAGDPQLHWHVLVANLSRGPDGRWTALDATSLYRAKRAAGVAFQAALRAELTRRLGVAWLPTVKDSADIAGIPARVLRLFSKRRQEIETELARTGTTGPIAAAHATLVTRADRHSFDPEGIEATWHAQAHTAGWGADHLDQLLAHPTTPGQEPTVDDLVAVVAGRLVGTDSAFTRHDITQAVAAALPAGAGPAHVDQLTAGVVAHPDIVPLGPDRGSGWEQRYTTRRLLAIEDELVATVANRTSAPVAALGHGRVAVAVRDATTLGPDQQAAVTRLLSQGNPVEVLVGRAGTGKTYTLATITAAYRAAGYQPIGVAPSARAARELADGTGLAAFTVPRYHHAIARQPLTGRSVVIVDEAAMCGTVDLHSVLTTAQAAGAKVILVGDHHQLPEVAAGGGFRAAVGLLAGQVCELTINRRVTEPWETLALDELRHGNLTAAWAAYQTHGRITVADDRDAIRGLAVGDWWAAHSRGERAFLLAGTRAETVMLNQLARRRAADAGLLCGPALETHGGVFQAGDRVLLGRNDAHQHGPHGQGVRVDNGTLATITAVHPDRTITIRPDNGYPPVRLRRDYIEAGWVQHGYAMTIHKSQGATCDRVFVVGPAGLYREAAYVALSRARHGAWLYATTGQAAAIELGHSAGIPLPDEAESPETALIARLERSEAKHLARTASPHALAAAGLAGNSLRELHDRLAHVRWAHTVLEAAGLCDPRGQQDALANAIAVRGQLAVGGRVRAVDRGNVGQVDAINDHHGTATITFSSTRGRRATRDLPWAGLKPIDRPTPQPLTNTARQWAADRQAETDRLTQRWARALANHSLTPDSRAVLETAVAIRTTRAFEALVAAPPDWLQWWVGQRPADPVGATTWDDTVCRIARWRDVHQVPDAAPGLGDAPTASDDAAEGWYEEMAAILRARQWLHIRAPQPGPVAIQPLHGIDLADRVAELDRLLDAAPPDCRPLINQLLNSSSDPDTLQGLLTEAHRGQAARRDWILANWPHVVERQQLARLLDGSGPLDHWPQPATGAVRRALDQLRETVPAPEREPRTLHGLAAELDAADAEEHLATLTAEVARLRESLRALEAGRRLRPPERQALVASEIVVRRRELDDTVERLASAQAGTHRAALHDTTVHDLHDGLRRRVEQLLYEAIHRAHPWLLGELGDLDARGTLSQLDPSALYQHLASMAADRELGVASPQPALSIPC